MKRIYSCMEGHQPAMKVSQQTQHVLLVCARCSVATNMHTDLKSAIIEWNNPGSQLWRGYSARWYHQFLRWWHGSFYGE